MELVPARLGRQGAPHPLLIPLAGLLRGAAQVESGEIGLPDSPHGTLPEGLPPLDLPVPATLTGSAGHTASVP